MLHTPKCMAAAIITAVNIFADDIDTTDVNFRINALTGVFVSEADMYLESGMVPCICPQEGSNS